MLCPLEYWVMVKMELLKQNCTDDMTKNQLIVKYNTAGIYISKRQFLMLVLWICGYDQGPLRTFMGERMGQAKQRRCRQLHGARQEGQDWHQHGE